MVIANGKEEGPRVTTIPVSSAVHGAQASAPREARSCSLSLSPTHLVRPRGQERTSARREIVRYQLASPPLHFEGQAAGSPSARWPCLGGGGGSPEEPAPSGSASIMHAHLSILLRSRHDETEMGIRSAGAR